eukprot:CAMPEP_0206464484 /NCGR_PEP_ID=MMETSP0324_2-20121206/27244_1 /ASSEMBLY_ACC=CAM_ASM_000836 /TAXON_ID=2866 /ORGANISM="Crypthecodinium cohnii, Strain Seligo" /LENGTH=53 /DNA_ID=CAMNT_0053937125 /DNA_START=85 /DNA_END=246 /DNA_ORIENTATION=+
MSDSAVHHDKPDLVLRQLGQQLERGVPRRQSRGASPRSVEPEPLVVRSGQTKL